MRGPRISVVTPSFNQGEFIEETLRSVLDQRYPGLELIVVDGGSTDNTLEILRRYESRLRWVSEPDRGQADAINKGLRMATGDVFAFLNSDDVYLPGAIRAVAAFFRSTPEANWVCGRTLMFGSASETSLSPLKLPRNAGDVLAWNYKAAQPGHFWRRDILGQGFNIKWHYCFDQELLARLCLDGHKCHLLDLPVAGYRLHGSSKTVAQADKFGEESDAIAAALAPFLPFRERRRVLATLELRSAAGAAWRGSALRSTFRALALWPRLIVRRPLWGTIRGCVLRIGRTTDGRRHHHEA